MSCFLVRNIKHTCEYNAGGIASIFLLDIRDFVSYTFKDDKLFNECFVENIKAVAKYIEISSVNESNFTETQDSDIYKQELSTYVRSLDAEKLSSLLVAKANRYLVAFKTLQGRAFVFGSDGGASLSFTQQTGQTGEVSGYTIKLTKNSIYPLFEVKVNELFRSPVWIFEEGKLDGDGIITRDGIIKTV